MSRLFAKIYGATDSSNDDEDDNNLNEIETVKKNSIFSSKTEVLSPEGAESEDDEDWRSCLIDHKSSTHGISSLNQNVLSKQRRDELSRSTAPTSSRVTKSQTQSPNTNEISTYKRDELCLAGHCDASNDDDDDWRKCLINYDPLAPKISTVTSRQTVGGDCAKDLPPRRKRPQPLLQRTACLSSSSDSEDSDSTFSEQPPPAKRTKKAGLASRASKKNCAVNVTEADLVDCSSVDFSEAVLSNLPTEELCNVTISVYLEEKKLRKDIEYLKKQLRALPARHKQVSNVASPHANEKSGEVNDQHNQQSPDDNYDHDSVTDNNENKSNISPSASPPVNKVSSPIVSTSDDVQDEACNNETKPGKPLAEDYVMHKSLQFVDPTAMERTLAAEENQAPLPLISPPVNDAMPSPTTTSSSINPSVGPPLPLPTNVPCFDLYLPQASTNFFKREPSRAISPKDIADSIDIKTEGESETNVVTIDEEMVESGSTDFSSSLTFVSTSASTRTFEIDLLILTIVSFLDFETRKKVAVLNSDCYAICSHNISFVPGSTSRLPELAHRSLYQDNVLVDSNKKYLEKHNISAVVKVGQSREHLKFHQSVWEKLSTSLQEEILSKFPSFFTLIQKSRAASIAPFGVVPHKALKMTGHNPERRIDRLIDLSAQTVVLDRQAKVHKQHFEICKTVLRSRLEVGESYSCLLGKISIRQPLKAKTSTQVRFNKYAWDCIGLSDEDKEKYFLSTGLVSIEVAQGRVMLLGGRYGGSSLLGSGRCSEGSRVISKDLNVTKKSVNSGSALVTTINRQGGINYSL